MKNLHYQTADGEWFTVSESGEISRPAMRGFVPSGEWKFQGIGHYRGGGFIPLSVLLQTLGGAAPVTKAGRISAHYRVFDIDHGTRRCQMSPRIVRLCASTP